jgi:anti-sigma B factor antagonist
VIRYVVWNGSTKVAGDREPPWEISHMELGLEVVESRPPYTVLAVKGEVDVYSAPRLREKLVELVSQGHRHIVVDLESVDFLDSTGLGVLVGGLKRLRSHEGDLTLVCTQARILKVFEITGLTTVFRIADSVEKATED